MYRVSYEGTVPQVSDTLVGGDPLIYRTKKWQVYWYNLPEAFLSGDFEVTAQLSMFSATLGYFQLNSITQVSISILIGACFSKYPLMRMPVQQDMDFLAYKGPPSEKVWLGD